MKISEILIEGLGSGLLKAATIAGKMFDPETGDTLQRLHGKSKEKPMVYMPPQGAATTVKSFGNMRVPAGQRLKVTLRNNQTYYKYPDGRWFWLAISNLPKGSTISPLQSVPEKEALQLDSLNSDQALSVNFERVTNKKTTRK